MKWNHPDNSLIYTIKSMGKYQDFDRWKFRVWILYIYETLPWQESDLRFCGATLWPTEVQTPVVQLYPHVHVYILENTCMQQPLALLNRWIINEHKNTTDALDL
jgi:hypothetical protein